MLKKWQFLLPLLAAAAVLSFSLSGCFKTPTGPSNLFTSGGNSGGGLGANPTPTPTPGGRTGGNGTITGTISGFTGENVTIEASNMSRAVPTTRTGDGSYTISNVPDGAYTVTATSASHFGSYSGSVTISGGNTASGINITALF